MILPNKRIIKTAIRLSRCAGWSAPLFVVRKTDEDRFLALMPRYKICTFAVIWYYSFINVDAILFLKNNYQQGMFIHYPVTSPSNQVLL